MRVLPAFLSAAALVACLAACGTATVTDTSDSGTPASSAKTAKKANAAKIGSTITLKGSDDKLKVAVKLAKVLPNPPGADQFTKPASGKRFYAVDLVMKNVGSAAYSDSPSNGAYLIDTKGQQYSPTIGEVKGGVAINTTTISKGDTRRGLIVFEVPKRAAIVKFQFALDSGFADQKGEWLTR